MDIPHLTQPPADPQKLIAGSHRIITTLSGAGHVAYWVGGAVRNQLLGLRLEEIDIATNAMPNQVTQLFPKAVLVGKSFGVVRVIVDEMNYEVATFRSDGLYMDGRHPEKVTYTDDPKLDASRRDFTINAMFLDPIHNELLDHVHGQRDLRAKIIRAVGNPQRRFREDRLRLLRAIRFAAKLDFTIEEGTWDAICREAPHITDISAERIRDELVRILIQPGASKAIRMMYDCGLLSVLLPEVARMKGVAQPPEFHPEGDVFDHSLLLLDHMIQPKPEIALAALFHDIGKPDTYELSDRIRFNGHDQLGAEMFQVIAQRLKLPKKLTEHVQTLIAQHMRLGHVQKMRLPKLKRFLRSETFPDLLELHRLDCLASHRDLGLYDFCKEQRANLQDEELKPPPLLTGNDLIAMGYKPGPKFKTILQRLEDQQLEGNLTTREAAVAYVQEHFKGGEHHHEQT